jgi:2-amino-4-hydroxy-6-hydroxymethyldihydropteridine diphosphokinase
MTDATHQPPLPSQGWIRVALGLGSNLGDRAANLRQGVALLQAGILRATKVSSFHETDPVDCPPDAGPYLNAAIIGWTRLSPRALLEATLAVEQRLGRSRSRGYHESRILDVDILLYGDFQLYLPELTIPHPGLCDREFVLAPLAELAPDWTIPLGLLTVQHFLDRLRGQTTDVLPRGFVAVKGQVRPDPVPCAEPRRHHPIDRRTERGSVRRPLPPPGD